MLILATGGSGRVPWTLIKNDIAGWTPQLLRKIDHLASVIAAMHTGQGPDLLGVCEIETAWSFTNSAKGRMQDRLQQPAERRVHSNRRAVRSGGHDCPNGSGTKVLCGLIKDPRTSAIIRGAIPHRPGGLAAQETRNGEVSCYSRAADVASTA
jgi:hypothetical protein